MADPQDFSTEAPLQASATRTAARHRNGTTTPADTPIDAVTDALIDEMLDKESDQTLVQRLVTHLREEPYSHLLFHPAYKRRFALIKARNAVLFQSTLLTAVTVYLGAGRADKWDASLTTLPQDFDPFVFTDAHALLAQPVMPRRWLIEGLIADGLTVIGGSPKGGKSYLAYALALATAHYGRWCNYWPTEQGKALYVSLEDAPNDSHLRLNELDPQLSLPAGRLLFVHGADSIPTFGQGLLEWIEQALEQHHPRLLVIDPISYLYVLKKSGSQFEETKDMLFPLRWLGKQYQCAIVCLDHRRKRSRDDTAMVDTLYGSVAKQAVADGLIMVNKDEEVLELDLTIRNGKQQKVFVEFVFRDGQCFLAYKGGETTPQTLGALRLQTLDVLRQAQTPLSITDVMAELGTPETRQTRNVMYQLLYRAQKAREIEKTTRGLYVWNGEREAGHLPA